MNDYQQQAADFLAKHGIKFSAKLVNKKSPPWSPDRKVNHFIVTLKNENRRVSFDFFDSVNNFNAGKTELDEYSVLACCSSEFNCPDSFEEFCSEFGYDADSRKAEKTFNACQKQSAKLKKIFDTVESINDLMEIR
jgi:hypothetical protein